MTSDNRIRLLNIEDAIPTMLDPPRLLTVKEAAECLSVCEATVRKMIREGSLASIKAGKMRRITTDELHRWVRRNEFRGTDK